MRPSVQSMKDWLKVKTKQDVIYWHQVYTPQYNDEQILQFVELYDKQLNSDDTKPFLKITNKFEQLLLGITSDKQTSTQEEYIKFQDDIDKKEIDEYEKQQIDQLLDEIDKNNQSDENQK